MSDTVFSKIIAGEIPATKVYEDETFLAFMDINPVTKGHTLLIPKEHYIWIHDTPDALIGEIFITAKHLINAMRTGLGCDYVQVGVVGNEVPHFHIHLIPRFLSESAQITSRPHVPYESPDEMKEYAARIANALLS